jgi:hypothetical protein
MPIVINEFEVVAEPPPTAATPETEQEQAPAQPTAHDVEQVLIRQIERAARVWAS